MRARARPAAGVRARELRCAARTRLVAGGILLPPPEVGGGVDEPGDVVEQRREEGAPRQAGDAAEREDGHPVRAHEGEVVLVRPAVEELHAQVEGR